MRIALLLAMLAFNGFTLSAAEIKGSKNLPMEINLVLDAYQRYQVGGSPDALLNQIKGIERYAQAIGNDDIFLIGKIEVYRTLLKYQGPANKTPINGDSRETLRKSIAKTNDTFLKWFLEALLKDVIDLMSAPQYNEFLLLKTNGQRIEKIEHKRLERKGELLQNWVSKLNPNADDFSTLLKSALVIKFPEILSNVEKSFKFLAEEGSRRPILGDIASKDFKFFSLSTAASTPAAQTQLPKAKPVTKESVEASLSGVVDTDPSLLPRPSDENWLIEDNAPADFKNLPKPDNNADWLQDF